MSNKNSWAKRPPIGWNSWDCYGASITEEELLGNAKYIEENLKQYGYEYVVCDIQWYEPDANSTEYRDFAELEIDEYSRLIPSAKRFPSAKNGVGFKKIADKIHAMGLKFGIHMMRGIPRQAVHQNSKIKGTDITARQIAQRFSVCSWNTDMYGIKSYTPGALEYYNSVFELYASWGVDFVKVDDICNTYFSPENLYSAKGEIELIRQAIDSCGREIVLSLSPGPADIERSEHLAENANMWRMTADYWDRWEDLYKMFERCNLWSDKVKEGCWPDCDMLPLGHINIRGAEGGDLTPRYSRFTKAEQQTMMSLWCIFRSPLMVGGEMRDNDELTVSILCNKDILRMQSHGTGARQLIRDTSDKEKIVWKSYDEDGSIYIAIFNPSNVEQKISLSFKTLGISGKYSVKDLWKSSEILDIDTCLECTVEVHGVKVFKLKHQ